VGTIPTVGKVTAMLSFGLARRRLRQILSLCLLIPAGVLLSSCHTTPPMVLVYGDSLATQTETYIDYFTSLSGAAQVVDHIFPGSMPCTWLNQMLADAHNPVQASAAVLEFGGITGIACMSGIAPDTPQYYARYLSDTTTAVDAFIAGGTHVFLVGYPINYADVNPQNTAQVTNPLWDHLNQMYQSIARAHRTQVTFVDAGASLEGPHHQFEWYLPCLSFEPECNVAASGWAVVPGYNQVRDTNGSHFCLASYLGVDNTCPVYSSGAMRYGLAIGGSVHTWLTRH
jgi:hypothetical protein